MSDACSVYFTCNKNYYKGVKTQAIKDYSLRFLEMTKHSYSYTEGFLTKSFSRCKATSFYDENDELTSKPVGGSNPFDFLPLVCIKKTLMQTPRAVK